MSEEQEPIVLDVTAAPQCCGVPNSIYDYPILVMDIDDASNWPNGVVVKNFFAMACAETERTYYYRKNAIANITMDKDSDNAVGKCTCSECQGPIDFNDRFCKHCGSKISGTDIYAE